MRVVAFEAGVSVGCVSLALRHDPRIPEKTRIRIQSIAERLNYRPNPYLAALMTHRQAGKPVAERAPLAFITGYKTCDNWKRDPMIWKMFHAANQRAEVLGYKLEPFWLKEPGMTHRRLSEILSNRGIHGVLLAPVEASRGHLSLQWENFASVTLGYSLWKPKLHRVCNHQYHTVTLAIRELKRLGYRRISLVANQSNNERVDRNWLAGFLVHSPDPENSEYALRYIPKVWKEQAFCEWVKKHRPEAIISPHREVWQWLKKMGYQLPKDIAFACLDWSEGIQHCAGVNQNHDVLGTTAIDLLVAQLQRNERGLSLNSTVTLIEGSWVNGETV